MIQKTENAYNVSVTISIKYVYVNEEWQFSYPFCSKY